MRLPEPKIMILLALAAGIAAVFVLILRLLLRRRRYGKKRPENRTQRIIVPEYQRAGIIGELAARRAVESILQEKDRLFTNLIIEFDGQRAEMDMVIVNRYGVYVMEVKNYVGRLVGGEEDFFWRKYKLTEAGNLYMKEVRNPIRQANRQAGILGRYLRYYGLDVWVRGYGVLMHRNSPVQSDSLLTGIREIDRAIHSADRKNRPDEKTVSGIVRLLTWQSSLGQTEK